MIGRRASSFIASALVVVHLLVGAFAEAAPMTGDVDCAAGPSAGAVLHTAALGLAPASVGSHHGSSGAGNHGHAHVVCRCGCSHTPALSVSRPFLVKPAPTPGVIGTLPAPAFDPPLFDFLRPPN